MVLVRLSFDHVASFVTRVAGSAYASGSAFVLILTWAVLGPHYHYSEAWQMVVNTGTTIITFLMVFLIQNAQNRDSKALHLKMDEVIRATKEARNEYRRIEDLPEKQIEALRDIDADVDTTRPA